MVTEKPTVKKRVVTRRPSEKGAASDFAFTQDMILAAGAPALDAYRRAAWDAYKASSLPNTSEEAWRRTDIRQLNSGSFVIPDGNGKFSAPPKGLLEPLAGESHGGQITLTPGGVDVFLEPALAAKGVVFTDIATAAKTHPKLLEKILGQLVKPGEDKFSALAAAFGRNGVFLYVPSGVEVADPLHSVLWGPGAKIAHLSHLLVWIEDGASATFVHEYASPNEDEQSLHAGIVEIHVGKGASLRFVELQSWGRHIWNFSHERARVDRDGNLDWVFGAVGSHLTKNFSELNLIGEGAVGRMSGFYFTDGEQHLDHDTQQNHLAPHTTSDLLFKGALEGHSRSVWQGMIYVAPGAQKTDGYQANRNLVLSQNARADSIPGLEILADDVRCTHGATVGKVDADEMFYLRSRGIPEIDAERLIVEGFFDPIMQRIPFEKVRRRFEQAILDKLFHQE
ncbi:MAG: Fe-S cluster assembly protein SufD [Anaerolineae bacterium]|nr:MAG: Fe-S cluster assembly protein SufD [Anaerolineae bacterium]